MIVFDATRNHIEVDSQDLCWHCEQMTYFIEISFEARLCPGVCTDAKWREYWIAESAAGPLSLEIDFVFPPSPVPGSGR